MKGFDRPYLRFSLCGLKCGLCPVHQMPNGCPGCGGGAGNQSCPIARCSLEHGKVEYCWQCGMYPCEKYSGFFEYDSFLPARCVPQDIQRVREIGLGAFCRELDARVDILEELLAGYNDGRKKAFYCTAASLLDWDNLQAAMEEIRTGPAQGRLSEKAAAAVSILNGFAQRQGISLALRRKPRNKKK